MKDCCVCGIDCECHGKDIVPLSELVEGDIGVIVDYPKGRILSQRVVEMGLHRGEKVQVLKSLGGPILVKVHASKVALGTGVAMKILVRKCNV